MTYTAVDCQGFAGGFTLGVAQAGFKLIGKREKTGGFGARNCEMNRHLLGDDWTTEACDPTQWSVPAGGADLVFGNPPCSGFSVLSSKEYRGRDSKINQCMWDFVEYAARVRPYVAVFESVQGAFTQGRSLMQDLREHLEQRTGDSWTLYHVLHNALSVGGPALRKRYFWVAVRDYLPFGVEIPQLTGAPVLRDVIGDLQTLDQRWDSQSYWLDPTWYSAQFRDRYAPGAGHVVDGHISIDNPGTRRTLELLNAIDWQPGEHIQATTRRYFDMHGDLPPSWKHLVDKLKGKDFFQGLNGPSMWHPDRPSRVITGGALLHAIHWAERRMYTHREAARIMGFPDAWLIEPLRGTSGLFLTWGKGITVHCGRWIAEWTRRSLNDNPGSLIGDEIGERERLIDVTNAWKSPRDTVNTTKVHLDVGRGLVTETAVAPGETSAQRGRPRPTETVDRDQRVFDALAVHGKSREALAGELGMEPNLVYLSLWRLKRDSRVERIRHEGTYVWQRVAGAQ